MSTVTSPEYYPLTAVQSRISWSAILAGAAVALGFYSLLTLLGVAIGITASDDVSEGSIGAGAGIWTFVALCLSLFIGGWVTTQCTVGENRTEAVLYGVVLWAVSSILLLSMTAAGLRMGLDMMATHQTIVAARGQSTRQDEGSIAATPNTSNQRTDDRAREFGRNASWWAFGASFVSLLAAVGGAMVGPIELTIRRETRVPIGRVTQTRTTS